MRVSENDKVRWVLLRKIADVGVTTRRSLNTLPFFGKTIERSLRQLLSEELISGKRTKSYRLLQLSSKGVAAVKANNSIRYADADYQTWRIEDKSDRKGCLGEARFVMASAGYSVHPHDKPDMEDQGGPGNGSPACADLNYSADDQAEMFSYPLANTGKAVRDTSQYVRRRTSLNCFYDSVEIRSWFLSANRNAASRNTNDALSFSRATGALFAGSGYYITYNAHHTALRIKESGETAFRTAAHVYAMSLYGYRQAGDKLMGGVLVFSDRSCNAAVNIVYATLMAQRGVRWNPHTNMNLESVRGDMWYVPVDAETRYMLQIIRFSNWERSLRQLGLRSSTLRNQFRETYAHGNVDAITTKGTYVYSMCAFNLHRALGITEIIRNSENRILVICLEWQRIFYEKLFAKEDLPFHGRIFFEILREGFYATALEVLQATGGGKALPVEEIMEEGDENG